MKVSEIASMHFSGTITRWVTSSSSALSHSRPSLAQSSRRKRSLLFIFIARLSPDSAGSMRWQPKDGKDGDDDKDDPTMMMTTVVAQILTYSLSGVVEVLDFWEDLP